MNKDQWVFLRALFKDITVMGALYLLCNILKAPNAIVFIDARKFSLIDLADSCSMYYIEIKARDVELRFFGGPPGRSGWYSGSLYSLLIDHLAYCLVTNQNSIFQSALQWLQDNARID